MYVVTAFINVTHPVGITQSIHKLL